MTKKGYLDNRDLALRVIGKGFKKVRNEVGERMDAVRASRIVGLLKREYGFIEADIDKELLALAAAKRRGHCGGPVTPPTDGEERQYTVSVNGRIGVPLGILDKKVGDKALVKYTKKQITIR
jgi:hypothetical protein